MDIRRLTQQRLYRAGLQQIWWERLGYFELNSEMSETGHYPQLSALYKSTSLYGVGACLGVTPWVEEAARPACGRQSVVLG